MFGFLTPSQLNFCPYFPELEDLKSNRRSQQFFVHCGYDHIEGRLDLAEIKFVS